MAATGLPRSGSVLAARVGGLEAATFWTVGSGVATPGFFLMAAFGEPAESPSVAGVFGSALRRRGVLPSAAIDEYLQQVGFLVGQHASGQGQEEEIEHGAVEQGPDDGHG